MKKELDALLCKKYPKIFRDRHADMRVTAMCWGFELGDGWFNIIDALCANIQGHIDWKRKERLGALRYNRALKKALNGDNGAALQKYYCGDKPLTPFWKAFWDQKIQEDIDRKKMREVPAKTHQVVATQVKEKFGTLRFYVYGADSETHAMINMAESMSARTCEVCGSPGTQNTGGWITTLCETHRNERENRNA